MAGTKESNAQEELSPLLSQQQFQEPVKPAKAESVQLGQANGGGNGCGWTSDGLPLTHGSVVAGEPMGRTQWDSDLLACLGYNDEFCSSDFEVSFDEAIAELDTLGEESSKNSTMQNDCGDEIKEAPPSQLRKQSSDHSSLLQIMDS